MTLKKQQPKLKQYQLISFCVVMVGILGGCEPITSGFKSIFNFERTSVWLEKVIINPVAQMNDTSPIKLDIVVCYNKDLLSKINVLDSNTYFQKKTQLVRDYKNMMDVFSMDVLPGVKREVPIQLSQMVGVGGVIFARYDQSDSINRFSIGTERILNIYLNEKSFKVQPLT
jgi:hypothetical protein